ncbi:hypothetical protein CUMW_196170 [Citrus unshiu]|nr:hypothetical protein CUMW_196170 [Citrus unshiu]
MSVTAVLLLEMPKQEDDLGISDLRIGAGSGIGESETRKSWMIDIAGVCPAVHDPEDNRDCFAWSNKQDTLCFNCNSCKAEILMDIKIEWSFLAIIINFFLFLIHYSACCTLITKLSEQENQIDSVV